MGPKKIILSESEEDEIEEFDKSEKGELSDYEFQARSKAAYEREEVDAISSPTVILETEDEGDSFHLSPLLLPCAVSCNSPEPLQLFNAPPRMPMPGTEMRENASGFRIQAKAYLLTYKTHLDKGELETFLTQTGGHRSTKTFLAAHETGDTSCPYLHTHVLVEFPKAVRSRDCRIFDFDGIHPNIKVLNGAKAVRDAEVYLCKEDVANADRLSQPTLIDKILSAPSAIEACRRVAEKPGDIGGILMGYGLKVVEMKLPDSIDPNTRPWQKEMLEICKKTAHPRHIYWLFDEIGLTGKSSFSNYLEDELEDDEVKRWFCLADVSNTKEVAHQVLTACSQGWNGHGVVVDLSRSFEHSSAVYTVLENLKNGRMTSVKYQGGRVRMAPPHVIVMANWWPDITRLSADRWKIREITQEYKLAHRSTTDRPVNESKHCRTCCCSGAESRSTALFGKQQ